jgi:hypothetical protein
MTEPPRIVVNIAAPAEAVWEALRDKEKIRHWHGWDYDGPGGLDGEIDQIYFSEYTEDAQAHRLELGKGDVFEIEPDGEGSRITLTRAPLGANPDWDAYYDDITEGWTTFLHQLKYALERKPGAERRTVFFSGHTTTSGPVADELGLVVDGRYEAKLAGEDVTGELWFRSANQLGVTVDGWGLLIVAYNAPTEAKPKGGAMAVLSTYGLDDAAYADLESRWREWWTPRYPGE